MSHQLLYFLSLLALAVGQVDDLRFSRVLNREGTYILRWGFNKTAEEITMEAEAPTIGWVGFGLSPGGSMAGADIVIGGVMPNQTTYFGDYHGLGKFKPVLDTVQNYKLISLSETGTTTIMRFSRKFRTCDSFDVDITANTQRFIAAYGTTDTIEYHGVNRFLGSALFLSDTPISEPPPDPSFIHDMNMTNFPVPSVHTTYACAYLRLPPVSQKIQIYKFDAVIQSGNEDLVHHIVLYGCPNNTNISIAPAVCNNNSDYFSCQQTIAVWAVGGQAFTFPSNVGIPLGTDRDFMFARTEVHYNNPLMQSGRTDSSGMRLYYTTALRPIDAEVLMTGMFIFNFFFIPPKAESFKISSICKTEKLNQVSGEAAEDMNVFAVLLHTHLTGRAVEVCHYRNGSQIGFLGSDTSYDFNLQETRYLPKITTIKVGDEVVVRCTYNTADRSNVTLGGLSTTDEMCLAFLYMYPSNSFAQCVSAIDYGPLSSTLGFNVTNNPDALNRVSWTPENIELVQKATKESTQKILLIPSNASFAEDTGIVLDTGVTLNITEPPVIPCNSSESSSTAPASSTCHQQQIIKGK